MFFAVTFVIVDEQKPKPEDKFRTYKINDSRPSIVSLNFDNKINDQKPTS